MPWWYEGEVIDFQILRIYHKNMLVGYKEGQVVHFIPEALEKANIWYFDRMLGMVDYKADYETVFRKFVMDRYGTKGRKRELEFLRKIGYRKRPVNDLEVIVMTNGKLDTDYFWIDFGEGEIFYGVEM